MSSTQASCYYCYYWRFATEGLLSSGCPCVRAVYIHNTISQTARGDNNELIKVFEVNRSKAKVTARPGVV